MSHTRPMFVSRFLFCAFGLSFAAIATAPANALKLEVVPASPRYQEPVYARLSRVENTIELGVITNAWTSMVGNVITVTYRLLPEIAVPQADVSLGQLPAGTYTVKLQREGFEPPYIDFSTQFTVAAAPTDQPLANYSGHWWNAAEAGSGYGITVGPTKLLFATWFTYGADGKPTWFTLEPGRWFGQDHFQGDIYASTGSYYLGPYVGYQQNKVGTGSIRFWSSDRATISVDINGAQFHKDITRIPLE